MKQVKSRTGEIELQSPEYAGPGSAPSDKDVRELRRRIDILEAQVRSLQMAAERRIG